MTLAGSISYGIAAIAFAVLAALLLASWRGGRHGMLLVVAAAATAAWALLLSVYAGTNSVPAFALESSELVRSGLWILFIAWLLSPMQAPSIWLRMLTLTAALAPAVALAAAWWSRAQLGMDTPVEHMGLTGTYVIGALVLALIGLVMLEQLYRNLPTERRWAIKFFCLGAGILFAYDLYLYSDALLFQRVDTIVWEARGIIQAVAAPLILIAARRNQSWALPVFVSRHVAFHTAVVVAAGGYLILISLGGYYIRDFGGTWGQFAQILLVAGALIALAVVVTSADVRARLRVFISKHFFSNKYDYREEWLRVTQRLADEQGGLSPYERTVNVVADIFGSPAGAVWRRQREGGFALAGSWRLRVNAEYIDEDTPLVAFLQRSRWIIDVQELRQQPGRYDGMALPPQVNAIESAWAVIPLLRQDTLSGFLLLTRPEANPEITWEDRDLMHALGRQIASFLGQHEDGQALSQARQFEAFNQLTAFLMHDLKNLIAQQSLVVKNAEKHKHNPEFVDDAMATIGDSVRRMERLLEHIQRRQTSGLIERVDVRRVLQEAAGRCTDRRPVPELELTVDHHAVEANPEEFAMVLVHLIRNAQDATGNSGEVHVRARVDEGQLLVEVADTGSGMSPEFVRDELFRPFRTTKSAKGMGIGAHQVREFVHRAGGRVSVVSSPGEGTRFQFRLPAIPLDSPDADAPPEEADARTIVTGGS